MKRHLLAIPGHAHIIEVRLYDTLEEMWTAVDKGDDFHGYYESLFRDDERPPIMGRIHMVRGKYGSGVVAHELLHAVLDVGFALHSERDADGILRVDDTEALCGMMGDLTAQFWCWHYELKAGE